MSLQLIARDLYRLKREVERLVEAERNAPESLRKDIGDRLRKTRAEYQQMRRTLEGAKTPPACRPPR